MSYQESDNDDGEYEKFSDNESNAEGFLSTLKVDESNADTSKNHLVYLMANLPHCRSCCFDAQNPFTELSREGFNV